MNKKNLIRLISVLLLLSVIGCGTYPARPTVKTMLITNCDGPIGATEKQTGSKIGKSSSTGVLNLVAWGDASIQSAMNNAGIKKVHHIDYNHFNFVIPYLNIPVYEEYTTSVYGE